MADIWGRLDATADNRMPSHRLMDWVWGALPQSAQQAFAPWGQLMSPMEWTSGAGVRDMVNSSGDLTRATMAGDPMGMLGAGAGMALGAIGAIPGGKLVTEPARAAGKAAAKAVPESWRLARNQNYNTRLDLYHATTGDIQQFDHARQGTGATLPGEETGATWLTSRPDMADSYLPRAPYEGQGGTRSGEARPPRPYAEGANIMPMWVRDMNKFYQVDAGGTMFDPGYVSNALKAAKERGMPGVVFKNFRDPGPHSSASRLAGMDPQKPGTVVAVFADEKLRSKYAQFDPARKGERDVLAGIVPVATAGGLVLLVPEPADEGGS